MARWRTDKKANEADTIETIRSLLPLGSGLAKDSVND
jgi:hypothetical protein